MAARRFVFAARTCQWSFIWIHLRFEASSWIWRRSFSVEKWPCFVLSDCLYQTNLGAIPVRPLCFTGMFGMFFICFHESAALPGFLGSRNRVWHVIQPRSYMKLFRCYALSWERHRIASGCPAWAFWAFKSIEHVDFRSEQITGSKISNRSKLPYWKFHFVVRCASLLSLLLVFASQRTRHGC